MSVHPMSQWDTCLSAFPSLVGRAPFIQSFRRMEHAKQSQSTPGQPCNLIGTAVVVLKAAGSSALVMYESLFRQVIRRPSPQLSPVIQPAPSNGSWREALKTMYVCLILVMLHKPLMNTSQD